MTYESEAPDCANPEASENPMPSQASALDLLAAILRVESELPGVRIEISIHRVGCLVRMFNAGRQVVREKLVTRWVLADRTALDRLAVELVEGWRAGSAE
jgi:hypothetical protein